MVRESLQPGIWGGGVRDLFSQVSEHAKDATVLRGYNMVLCPTSALHTDP